MALNTELNSEIILDLEDQPLDKDAAALLKAIDQLLTVGAYYSTDHDQYRAASEKSCAQIVRAIGQNQVMAIEVTASGLLIRSQMVDPHHRKVRLLHDLLVPLNIARLEISAKLTPGDLRAAISTLQLHKQDLGHTTGFQEIKIENLPPTVSTASRGVVQGLCDDDEDDDLFDCTPNGAADGDPVSASERLAREFMKLVGRILENLEQAESPAGADGSAPATGVTPENIKTLRESLRRLVEVNPDPADLTRLIEHAKRALDLSRDPGSVDLVFSLLKKELQHDGDWKYKSRDNRENRPGQEYRLNLEQLRKEVSALETAGGELAEPNSTALGSYLGICFHLLASGPAEALETSLVSSLERVIASSQTTNRDLESCSEMMTALTRENNRSALDTLLPAFCGPLRVSRPEYLGKFWAGLWKSIEPDRRSLVWPHLVSDLMLGLDGIPSETIHQMWQDVGRLDSREALRQVSRLEQTAALRDRSPAPGLMALPLAPMYPVHLALMKSSLASVHGPRLHKNLYRHPPNGLTEILMKSLGTYNPARDSFYLSLIRQTSSDSITPDLRRMSARLIAKAIADLPPQGRDQDWVIRAIGWLEKLDPAFALPLLTRISREKRYLFFKAWPVECRELAEKIIADLPPGTSTKDGG